MDRTEKQQCLLSVLGDYTLRRQDGSLAVDGIPGPATREAILSFQRRWGLDPDGVWGPKTEAAVREAIGRGERPREPEVTAHYRWFDYEALRCRCGGRYCGGWPARPHERTLGLLEQIGGHFGRKLVIHSGLRCPRWNAHVGGVSDSRHLRGMAVDFHLDGISPRTIAAYAETLMPDWGGIGVYAWGIHLDDREQKARWRG